MVTRFRKPAAAIAARCDDAYSSGRYRSWPAVAEMLLARGYDAQEVEAIMRSKWTRWAADAGGKRYGHATATDLAAFMDDPRSFGRQSLAAAVADLVKGTF